MNLRQIRDIYFIDNPKAQAALTAMGETLGRILGVYNAAQDETDLFGINAFWNCLLKAMKMLGERDGTVRDYFSNELKKSYDDTFNKLDAFYKGIFDYTVREQIKCCLNEIANLSIVAYKAEIEKCNLESKQAGRPPQGEVMKTDPIPEYNKILFNTGFLDKDYKTALKSLSKISQELDDMKIPLSIDLLKQYRQTGGKEFSLGTIKSALSDAKYPKKKQ